MTEEKHYIYAFVREDLSPAQQIIQVSHAVEVMLRNLYVQNLQDKYLAPTRDDLVNNMVLFAVRDASDLLYVSSELDQKQVHHICFNEPDINEFTAIATVPLSGAKRRVMENYSLKV